MIRTCLQLAAALVFLSDLALASPEDCVRSPYLPPPASLGIDLADHVLWLETGGRQGVQADLRDRDLNGVDLHDVDLRGVDLRGADLTQAVLTGANLEGAMLDGAVLDLAVMRCVVATLASFNEAKMFGVDLTDADLVGATLTKEPRGLANADLTGANLTNADLANADLRQAILTDADLAHTGLAQANLERAQLQGALLHNTDVTDADLTDADVRGAIWQASGTPTPASIARMQNLGTLRLDPDRPAGAGMGLLIRSLRLAGEDVLAREVLRARERSMTAIYWNRAVDDGDLWAGAKAAFREAVWAWPVDYGTRPFRVLAIAVLWNLAFIPVYALWGFRAAAAGRPGIYRTRVEGTWVRHGIGFRRLKEDGDEERIRRTGVWPCLGWGSWFATITALRLGVGTLNVLDLLGKVVHWPRIEAAGWLAPVAACQSMVSSVLMVVFTVSLFGQPLG